MELDGRFPSTTDVMVLLVQLWSLLSHLWQQVACLHEDVIPAMVWNALRDKTCPLLFSQAEIPIQTWRNMTNIQAFFFLYDGRATNGS